MITYETSATQGNELIKTLDIIDCEEGCLLDNFWGYTPDNELVFVKERYINANMSGYGVAIAENDDDEQKLYYQFNSLRTSYTEQ